MVFEDDSSNPDIEELVGKTKSLIDINKANKANQASGSRVSARGKREKKIYDPSDNNGPVHKKKKDAIEAQLTATKKTPQKPQLTKTPVKTPAKVDAVPVKLIKPPPTPQSAKRKLDMDSGSVAEKVQKIAPIPIVKEPSKRAQARKEKSVEKVQTEILVKSNPSLISTVPIKGILRSSASSERSILTSSTVPARDITTLSSDISKWTPSDVAGYFVRKGFDRKDAQKFKEEEIDGETLLILQRDDLKNLNLKVGIFVKMWNHIVRFQSGYYILIIV
jgi:hypothetical protein